MRGAALAAVSSIPHCDTTKDVAVAIGATIDWTWDELMSTPAEPAWDRTIGGPDGAPVFAEDAKSSEHRAVVAWRLDEDPYTDDETWFGYRIEEATSLERPDAAAYWRDQRIQSRGPDAWAAEVKRREIERVAAEHAARQLTMFEPVIASDCHAPDPARNP
jgi:hypothetical protein